AAQVVLTSADMPSPAVMLINATDSTTALNVGMADTGQVWSFTSVIEHTKDTNIVMNYSDYPNAQFSSATSVIKQGNSGFYGYFNLSSTNYTLSGGSGLFNVQGTLIPVTQTYTPFESLMEFPAAIDSIFNSTYTTDAKFYYGQPFSGITIDSIHSHSYIQKTLEVDASGTLTTLLGGPYNVVRVKETKISNDTAMAYFFGDWQPIPNGITSSQIITYYWWANGIGAYLASARVDANDNVLSFSWLTELPGTPPVAATSVASNTSCEAQCDGTATVTAKWGNPPYNYSWSTSPVQTTETASGLCAGTYTVVVTDSLLNTTSNVVVVGTPEQPVIIANGATLTADSASTYQWYLNDTLISGATNINYTMTQNGNYTVVVTNGACTDTSAAYTYSAASIDMIEAINMVSIFPNPANNKITVVMLGSTSTNTTYVAIKNQLGQTAKETTISTSNNQTSIDISELPKGVYFVTLKNEHSILNKSFIKQ
ncbi:MAG: T9SS type A sorting domain-containing protein, partial [Bacteroidia bacterium]